MPAPIIRPAILADIPAITRIYADAVTHGTASFELEPADEAEMQRRMETLLAGNFPYLAAESCGPEIAAGVTSSVQTLNDCS